MNFPLSPTVDQEHTEGGRTWKWSGVAWELLRVPGETPSFQTWIFTSPGVHSWTLPPHARALLIQAWGGGGGAASDVSGGGGEYAENFYFPGTHFPTTSVFEVGVGGGGTSGAITTAGGTSYVDLDVSMGPRIIEARGGKSKHVDTYGLGGSRLEQRAALPVDIDELTAINPFAGGSGANNLAAASMMGGPAVFGGGGGRYGGSPQGVSQYGGNGGMNLLPSAPGGGSGSTSYDGARGEVRITVFA